MKILILGVNGFIGSNLTSAILSTTDWEIYGMDMSSDKLGTAVNHPRFHFLEGDLTINKEWVEYHVKKCDVCLPLVAIATPATYVQDPLRVFRLDFEENLEVIRQCARYKTRVLFPSTSEVYGMCSDEAFDPTNSNLVYGPIHKERWIYACAKQLLDRVIYAMGKHENLQYTLFRPFNWVGPGLDSIHSEKEGSSRVVTQFLGHLLRGERIRLVDGGSQRRCFTAVSDGIDALTRIISNKDGAADSKIFNLGNPSNDLSVRELATKLKSIALEYPEVANAVQSCTIEDISAQQYYGDGYQDMTKRTPDIDNITADLGWTPKINTESMLRSTVAYYINEFMSRERSVYDYHLRHQAEALAAV
jgi:nucleoside-diphosphate-sugar epimerase